MATTTAILNGTMIERVIKETSRLLDNLPEWARDESMELAMDSLVPYLHRFDMESISGQNELGAVTQLMQLIALIRPDIVEG